MVCNFPVNRTFVPVNSIALVLQGFKSTKYQRKTIPVVLHILSPKNEVPIRSYNCGISSGPGRGKSKLTSGYFLPFAGI